MAEYLRRKEAAVAERGSVNPELTSVEL